MAQSRPDPAAALQHLKDFQRRTVDFVFRRMYLDDDAPRRFLVADEVGLGKTMIARGVIACAIDHLWDRTERIDVVYVCSNADIARQNIDRLRVGDYQEMPLSSRITLLPISLGAMQHRRVNFVSFTPGTSLDLKDSAGVANERALLYWLLAEAWDLQFKRATRVLEGYMQTGNFRRLVDQFPQRHRIHQGIQTAFVSALVARPDIRAEFDAVAAALPRTGAAVSKHARDGANRIIGELRRLLAETSLQWLQPDLIVLDEFQRFKPLLQGDAEDASESAQLAAQLFNYQAPDEDPAAAARVLLLSATPYKMYTLNQETEQDDHYQDFLLTLKFLMPDATERQEVATLLQQFRQAVYRVGHHGEEQLAAVKSQLEQRLRRVMVRTERLATSADRNGMLREVAPVGVSVTAGDLQQFVGLQRVAKRLGHHDVLDYWKSSPYLLNFMEDYDLKRKFKASLEAPPDPELKLDIRSLAAGLLNRRDIESYRKLDPGNARLRGLHEDTIKRGAWKLLWIPPALPYYQGAGAFVDPQLVGFTKRLVFSSWRVAPKAIASVLSYEAERSMMQTFRRGVQNTAEARRRRRGLLRFSFSKGRATGMPAVGLIYPCRTLAEKFDPFQAVRDQSLSEVVATFETQLSELLAPMLAGCESSGEAVDERWYWAAPLLLDLQADGERTRQWFAQTNLAPVWSGGSAASGEESAQGWAEHLQLARETIEGRLTLGAPPADLARVMAELAIAGPGVTAIRMLLRLADWERTNFEPRDYAAPLAYSFLHLFNLPEAMFLIRDRQRETPYWRSVLAYCGDGNLQAVLDEYGHLLVESLGLLGEPASKVAEGVSSSISAAVSLRTSTAKAELIDTDRHHICIEDDFRFRTRFAMRFGDQDKDDGGAATRADQVRGAFNSPFWPFVLASTSVGQEGLDFHPYCHAVVHWNLPSNPVDLEQREGRVHRYKGHAVRKNVAHAFHGNAHDERRDPWEAMFAAACRLRQAGQSDLYPYWMAPEGPARIERHVPALPHSREILQHSQLRRSLVLYRMVFGQNRQQDLVEYMMSHVDSDEIERRLAQCCIDLAPISVAT